MRQRSRVGDLFNHSRYRILKTRLISRYENLFRPESHGTHQLPIDGLIPLQQDLEPLVRRKSALTRTRGLTGAVEQIDASQKRGHEPAPRPFVERPGLIELHNPPLVHDGNVVRHRHRLLLIVRDEDERRTDGPLNGDQLALHLCAKAPVECRHGFVQQQDGGFHHQASGECDALALPAGQLVGTSAAEVHQAGELEGPRYQAPAFGAIEAPRPQAILDVSQHRQMRKQSVALKHHIDRPLKCRDGTHVPPANLDASTVGVMQPRDNLQKRGFSRPGGAQQRNDRSARDCERYILEYRRSTEGFRDVRELENGWIRTRHASMPRLHSQPRSRQQTSLLHRKWAVQYQTAACGSRRVNHWIIAQLR